MTGAGTEKPGTLTAKLQWLGGVGMKLLGLSVSLFVLATTVRAEDDLSGRITAIDPAARTLEISCVKVMAKDAKVKGLLMRSSLERLKVGDNVSIEGAFSGPRQFVAKKIEKKLSLSDEIEAKVDMVSVRDGTIEISGITIKVPASTIIEDENNEPITLYRIVKGEEVKVKGSWTGPCVFTADSVELQE